MVSPMFTTVGSSTGITIDSLKVTGYTPYDPDAPRGTTTGTSKEVIIKVLDAFGNTAKDKDNNEMSFSFCDDEDTYGRRGDGPGAGWYRGTVKEANKVTTIPFDIGDGLWIQGKDGRGVLVDGQVTTNMVIIPLRQGSTPCGNPYPLLNPITNFTVTGYPAYDPDAPRGTTTGSSKEVIIKVLDAFGNTAKEADDETKERSYSYCDDEDTYGRRGDGPGAGWYRGTVKEANKVTDVKFKAGEGLWVQGKDGRNLVIKCPEIK